MIEQKDLNVKFTINGQEKTLKLLVTLGFWKKCGFKREEAQVIETDPEVYSKALKLAIFYGNKKDFGWTSQKDMESLITDDMIDDLEESHAQKLSFAMVHYLPEKLRKVILKKLNESEDEMAKTIDQAMDAASNDGDSKKK